MCIPMVDCYIFLFDELKKKSVFFNQFVQFFTRQ